MSFRKRLTPCMTSPKWSGWSMFLGHVRTMSLFACKFYSFNRCVACCLLLSTKVWSLRQKITIQPEQWDNSVCVGHALQAVDDMLIVGSSTNTSLALHIMRTVIFSPDRGDRPDVNNIGVVITDGQSGDEQVQRRTFSRNVFRWSHKTPTVPVKISRRKWMGWMSRV